MERGERRKDGRKWQSIMFPWERLKASFKRERSINKNNMPPSTLDRQGEEESCEHRTLLYSLAPPSMQWSRGITRNLNLWSQSFHSWGKLPLYGGFSHPMTFELLEWVVAQGNTANTKCLSYSGSKYHINTMQFTKRTSFSPICPQTV